MKGYIAFKKPYLLIEDSNAKFQPIYKEYEAEIPAINLDSPELCCPFSAARRTGKNKKKSPIKSGYCEICYMKYEDYEEHIRLLEHRQYAEHDHNYRLIDVFIKEFLEKELYGFNGYTNSPCERLEEKYSNGQPIVYSSELGSDSLIRVSKGSIGDFEDIVDFKVILKDIRKNLPQ